MLPEKKVNCWEFKKCGREPGGDNVAALGVCLAALQGDADSINNGKNGGRICWAISGTFCGRAAQCTFANEVLSCLNCKFYRKVEKEEGANFKMLKRGQMWWECSNIMAKKRSESKL